MTSIYFFVLAMSLMKSSLSFLNIFRTIDLNFVSGRLLASFLFNSFSGVFYRSVIWDVYLFLCFLILVASLCLFLCIRIDPLHVPVMAGWPNVVNILWDP